MKYRWLIFCLQVPLLAQAAVNDSDLELFSLESLYGDEEFVSIATGTKKPIYKAPSVATVITSDDIEAMGATSIHQALETVTGLHVYPSKLNRMNPSYSIRGIHTDQSSQVLVLVNGIRTTYEFTGAKWNLFELGTNVIDRIEVIKGPGSAMFGADAFSAVINIITKDHAHTPSLEAGIKHGSFNSKGSWFSGKTQLGKLNLSANIQWQSTDGDPSRIVESDYLHQIGLPDISLAPGPLDTRLRYLDAHFEASYQNINIRLWHSNIHGGSGAGAAQALSDNDYADSIQTSLTMSHNHQINESTNLITTLSGQTARSDHIFRFFQQASKPARPLLPKVI